MGMRFFIKSVLCAGMVLLMCFLCSSCEEEQASTHLSSGEVTAGLKETRSSTDKGGVAITFDDAFIDEWCSVLELLDKYDVKVTFFVTHWDKLDAEQIRKLKVLQNAGHEIGCHGLTHKSINDYESSANGLQKYVNEEIIPAIRIMDDYGFPALSFAYAKGGRGEFPIMADQFLLIYFHYIRITYGIAASKIPHDDLLYYKCGSNRRVLSSLNIDGHSLEGLEGIQASLQRAVERNEIVVFYAHRPSNEPGKNNISIARLEAILKASSELGLNFYRVCDLLNCHTN
jgi:peptidoglycan/xylan/chitin deacetylase (PgdA/CDA1 family)